MPGEVQSAFKEGKIIHRKGFQALGKASQRLVKSLSLDMFKSWIWHLGSWFSGGLGSVTLTVGLGVFRDPLQPK